MSHTYHLSKTSPSEPVSATKGSESTDFLASFRGIGTTHMTGSSSRGQSKEPVSQSRQRKAPLTGCPNGLLTVKECRSDGLDPLLRELNLSPQCE